MDYAGAAIMDLVLACTGLGLSLLGAGQTRFNVQNFNVLFALLMAVAGLGTAFASIHLSRLSDRFGRRPMILLSLAGLTVCSLLFAFATRWWHLFAIMAVRSQFMGIFWPSLEARITDGAEGPEMTRRLGLFGISFCTGLLLGYVLSGVLSDHWERAPFFVATGFGILLLILFKLVFARDRTHDGHRTAADRDDPDPARTERARRLRPAFVLSAWVANAVNYACAAVLRNIFPRFARLDVDAGGLGFSGLQIGFIAAGTGAAMLLAFVVLGKYHFWHYRFRYLLLAQLGAVGGSLIFAIAAGPVVLFLGALLIGSGAGVVYISSIYYSLDQQAARAGQSGLHEGILCFGFTGGMILVAAVSKYFTAHRTPYWLCVAMAASGIGAQIVIYALHKRRLGAG